MRLLETACCDDPRHFSSSYITYFLVDISLLISFLAGLSEDMLSASRDQALWLLRRLLPGKQRISF